MMWLPTRTTDGMVGSMLTKPPLCVGLPIPLAELMFCHEIWAFQIELTLTTDEMSEFPEGADNSQLVMYGPAKPKRCIRPCRNTSVRVCVHIVLSVSSSYADYVGETIEHWNNFIEITFRWKENIHHEKGLNGGTKRLNDEIIRIHTSLLLIWQGSFHWLSMEWSIQLRCVEILHLVKIIVTNLL